LLLGGILYGSAPAGMQANRGRVPIVDQQVDFFACLTASLCLRMPGQPRLTTFTNALGRFFFMVPADVLQARLFVLIQAQVQGTVCRILLTPSFLAALAGAGGGAAQLEDIVLDPIAEAASRLLDDAGVDDYSDDAIAAIQQAVDVANADSSFDGLTVIQANDLAEETAANDPAVQELLTSTRATPTPTPSPCPGDCDRDGSVTVDDIVIGVNVHLGELEVSVCPSLDADGVGGVSQSELRDAVGRALDECAATD
jgi:hypothetical protein